MEQWKKIHWISDIPGDKYSVSNYGRVRIEKHIIKNPYRNIIRIQNKPSKILKTYQTLDKRVCVDFTHNKKKVKNRVHRLVAYAFCKGDKSLEINHIDGNPLNNHFSNLEWVTSSENKKHAYDTGLTVMTKERKQKIADSCRKFSPYEISGIRERFSNGERQSDIAKSMNVTRHDIHRVIRRYK